VDEQPPHSAYAAIMGAFAGGLAAAGILARLLGREPREHTAIDLVTLMAANFKAAHTLAHDEVTSFLREPFVQGRAHEGGEEPAAGGARQAIGELLTCTRCVGTWTAGGLAATQVLWPRFGRLVTWTLAAAGANDFLQAAFSALTAKANQLER
jgi:uncharacterized protein DUF1360